MIELCLSHPLKLNSISRVLIIRLLSIHLKLLLVTDVYTTKQGIGVIKMEPVLFLWIAAFFVIFVAIFINGKKK